MDARLERLDPQQMRNKKRDTGGYLCAGCGSTTAVIDSRQHKDGIRRRRGCPVCKHRFTTLESEGKATVLEAAPIPMRLVCPSCGELHIDDGEFATKPHHTHACQECGEVWRPAVVMTVGVRFLPGFRNDEATQC